LTSICARIFLDFLQRTCTSRYNSQIKAAGTSRYFCNISRGPFVAAGIRGGLVHCGLRLPLSYVCTSWSSEDTMWKSYAGFRRTTVGSASQNTARENEFFWLAVGISETLVFARTWLDRGSEKTSWHCAFFGAFRNPHPYSHRPEASSLLPCDGDLRNIIRTEYSAVRSMDLV